MSIETTIRVALDQGATADDAAAGALAAASKDELRDLARAHVAHRARCLYRERVRAIEDRLAAEHGGSVAAAFTKTTSGQLSTGTHVVRAAGDPLPPAVGKPGTTPQSRGGDHRSIGFMLPDGRVVLWGEATADDHLSRAAAQRKLGARCILDAERHEDAAERIRAAGVRCLNQLPPAGDLAKPMSEPPGGTKTTTSHTHDETQTTRAGGAPSADADDAPNPDAAARRRPTHQAVTA